MFVDHFFRNPKPPKGARLDTPLQSDLLNLVPEGRLLVLNSLTLCASLGELTPKALRALLGQLVGSGFVLEVSGHRLDTLTR